jgi:ATP citrate (pro-S)-lyase
MTSSVRSQPPCLSQVWPAPFGRSLTKEEAYIQKLDGSTGASLKLTVLNPKGRIWTMVAGGGASVVYSDAIAAHGFAHELANYGEYSGAPTEGQTYEYAKTISEFCYSMRKLGRSVSDRGVQLI